MVEATAELMRMRIDKWLWCARFFKSRAQAGEAVAGGKVHVNGERVKPAHPIKTGDRLEITQAALVRELLVVTLAARRGPAAEAARCYEETAASSERRAHFKEQHALAAAFAPRPRARPDKRQRRRLMKLRRQE
ncbi:MAG TPA: RNA-binding S4 domain-containing protein [Steroidobacteraceae bacterium]|nr:RNA-binding S4 domain-containing protein [Steroidobacteraceae bacterium]